jgi:16S rRNA (guanine966-N2)-methyltransferase
MTQIRIIGGKYRGRKLSVLDSPGLRPTPNRIRETLFNWLQFEVQDKKTLDLFAGSGLLSFEALSRGAKSVTLLEKEKKTFVHLKKNANFFDASKITLLQRDAFEYIKHQSLDSYGLIFIDPPFNTGMLNKLLHCLKNKLSPDTLLYIESENEIKNLPFECICIKEKKTSTVFYSLFKI